MSLVTTLTRYRTEFYRLYGHRLSDEHRHALSAMIKCRTAHYGQLNWHCAHCNLTRSLFRSCGHRSCPRCQNQDNTQWLMRQQQKLLPVKYFMITFTLPAELRDTAWRHQREVYELLFSAAVSTCRDFALRDKQLHGEIGQTAVLHTQTRRLEYHPHVHVIIPAGAIDKKSRCWREKRGKFLFVQKALAKVFRARLLKGLSEQVLLPGKKMTSEWIVDCRPVGSGLPALKYLSRYLYRGVLAEKQLISDDGQQVTFSYRKGGTGERCTRTIDGPRFIWLILQHVLPRGFRRVRDYGFLHGNAKRRRILLQWLLKVMIPAAPTYQRKAGLKCTVCRMFMTFSGYRKQPIPGYN